MSNKAIVVNDVSVRFNLAREKVDNVKEYALKKIRKQLHFDEFYALRNVSFSVERGDAFAIIGENGCGKSTLLKAISGIYYPDTGSVKTEGNISPLIELGAGFDMDLTARENIFLNGAVLGYSKDFMQEHFDEIIDFSELHEFIDVPLKNYSSGMIARLGFAIATVTTPDILIVDEILAVGDMNFQKKCEKKMQEMLSGGVTLLFVSHDINQVKSLCRHAI
jgi:ABC-type polysaccharide/polyol phosphate transport system ATPase subunit